MTSFKDRILSFSLQKYWAICGMLLFFPITVLLLFSDLLADTVAGAIIGLWVVALWCFGVAIFVPSVLKVIFTVEQRFTFTSQTQKVLDRASKKVGKKEDEGFIEE
jgi:membrane protein implicated in regulation of membrane protease activity